MVSRPQARCGVLLSYVTEDPAPRATMPDHRQAAQLLGACRAVMPSVLHCTDQYANNRAEVSHQPTRQRERQMRRFTSAFPCSSRTARRAFPSRARNPPAVETGLPDLPGLAASSAPRSLPDQTYLRPRGVYSAADATIHFKDETRTEQASHTTKLLRRYGRAPRGARVHDHAPCGRWQTSTFFAALRVTGLTAPGVFDGAIDGESFRAYIDQILVPTLHPVWCEKTAEASESPRQRG